jgi:hypothetical protein
MNVYYVYIMRMYIAAVPRRTSPPEILMRGSYRGGRRVKTRAIANISNWDPARIEVLHRAPGGIGRVRGS